MHSEIHIQVPPSKAYDLEYIHQQAIQASGLPKSTHWYSSIMRRSLDARSRNIHYVIKVGLSDKPIPNPYANIIYKNVESAMPVHIIGAGPAGLFAALKCLELGLKPIVIERGKDVRERRRDLAALNKNGILNTESNYCFGLGGAGTYSDGKLYTRSNKRGDVQKILHLFHQFGASDNILTDAHPHIGTNKLPQIIEAIRAAIVSYGGEVRFNTKLEDFIIEHKKLKGIRINGTIEKVEAVILATGHSAGDIYELLDKNKVRLEAKTLAIGVRVEHPQSFVDHVQYKNPNEIIHLPPAAYSLVSQEHGRGVFSFCMCPGGIIAPASTQEGHLVVNGWSPSKRNNFTANSGVVVTLLPEDFKNYHNKGALACMAFQAEVEQIAYQAGGGNYIAPAQRITDFINKKSSSSLPDCSYLRGVSSANLSKVLPKAIYQALASGFASFNKKMRGYIQEDAIVVATESRTSAPVRIPRDKISLEHIEISSLFPCGEGAGYAGGIVSAAIDGENVAFAVYQKFKSSVNR